MIHISNHCIDEEKIDMKYENRYEVYENRYEVYVKIDMKYEIRYEVYVLAVLCPLGCMLLVI